MAKHKWSQPRNWDDGRPMYLPIRPPPLRCEVCTLVVMDTWKRDLPDRDCPGTPIEKDSLLWQMGGMVPTVQLGSKAAEGITPERQALLDIVELIDNQYDDLYVLRMVDQIAKKALYE